MSITAHLVDDEGQKSAYGSVYAIAQTAVSLAYGLGPLLGSAHISFIGYLVSKRSTLPILMINNC